MRDLNPALDTIRHFEGCVLHAYQDPVGVWTIGWGHTENVYPGQHVTQAEADSLLLGDVREFAMHVEPLLKRPATNNQFCALVSFAFNVGLGALHGSTLLHLFNAGHPIEEVAQQFGRWIYGGTRVLPGLVRRRKEEAALFLKADA